VVAAMSVIMFDSDELCSSHHTVQLRVSCDT